MTPGDDVARVREIADGLSKAQREAVQQATDGMIARKYGLAAITHGLWREELLMPRPAGKNMDRRLTPLGKQVRAYLKQQGETQ